MSPQLRSRDNTSWSENQQIPFQTKSINLEEKIVAKRSKIALAAEAGEEENNENQEQPAGEVVTEPQEPVEEPTAPGEEVTEEQPPVEPPAEPAQEPVVEPPAEPVEPPAEPAPEAPAEPEKKDDGRFNETFVSTGSGYVVNVIRRKRRELGK